MTNEIFDDADLLQDDDYMMITLSDEDGVEYQFEIVAQCQYEDEDYVAMVEWHENERDYDDTYVIFRCGEPDEDGLQTYDIVDDDEELLAVSKIFEEMF